MQIDQIRDQFEMVEAAIAGGPIVPNVAAEEIRAYLGSRFDFTQPMPLDEVIADVEQMLRKWQVQVTHPRYFGLYNPSVTLASVVADTLVAMYNSQLANWRTSPAANEMERHTLAWLADKFACKLHCHLHERRLGGKSLRGRGCVDVGISPIRRTWPSASRRRPGHLSHGRDPSRLQQDCAHGRAWTAQPPHRRNWLGFENGCCRSEKAG